MRRFTGCVIHMLLMCILVSATRHGVALSRNRTKMISFEISSLDFPYLFLSKQVQQVVELKVGKVDYIEEEADGHEIPWDIDILILSAQDYKIVKLDKEIKLFVSLASDEKLQHLSLTDPITPPDFDTEQYDLDKILSKNLNHSLISSFTLSPKNVIGKHPLETPGNYCIVAFLNHPKENAFVEVEITFRESHGELSRKDYKFMHNCLAISFIYVIGSFLYSHYALFKNRDSSIDLQTIGHPKRTLANREIQVRILTYIFQNFLYYFLLAAILYQLNMDDPNNTSITGLGFHLLLKGLYYNGYFYNVLLMFSGYCFTSTSKKQRFLWFIRWVTIFSIITHLLIAVDYGYLDYEKPAIILVMFSLSLLQYLVCFIFCSYFSVKTYFGLLLQERTSTANKFLATGLMVPLPFVLQIAGNYLYYSELSFNPEQARSFKDVVHLASTLLIAFMWKDTFLESEKVLKTE
ncbi:unnamed protein product [Kuraishia capsulata CBS 1993]|uniref:Intimal thickness related receptor IRP domain-containing protein n=1 Tax=Kuraishia capsulata CBS 1993 TaxID=1382522 RepID=W6MP55_9ASCO|nr:uncharacterized protein KUCA_T00004019001 [Kuraishia capsulata CBS 1993]CDK28038.1 unnamed protein product [Kuraishia capsulata CBS 1993]